MQSKAIISLFATLGLTAAMPAAPSNATLSARDTQYTVTGYDGSCIPENQNFLYYGGDNTLAACIQWQGSDGVTIENRSVQFGIPEGYKAQIFSSGE
jgi:hypothetical protein